jgi:hypothetical protein
MMMEEIVGEMECKCLLLLMGAPQPELGSN